MALKQVKNKIVSTLKTGKVTKAMESVSAVKMRKSQEKAKEGRPYVKSAMRILSKLAASQDIATHPLAQKRESGLPAASGAAQAGKKLVVIVTTDKGLAGSVNSAVLKRVEAMFEGGAAIDTICVGRKALEFANREKKEVLNSYTNISDEVTVADVADMTTMIMEKFMSEDYVSVEVIYQNFLSTFEQEPTVRKILPLDPAEIHYIFKDIKISKKEAVEEAAEGTIVYTVEPSAEEVFTSLVPQLVQIILYHALIESKASEHSARMVAMKNATDKSKEVAKALTLVYNKERQAAITAEVAEITGGMEVMK